MRCFSLSVLSITEDEPCRSSWWVDLTVSASFSLSSCYCGSMLNSFLSIDVLSVVWQNCCLFFNWRDLPFDPIGIRIDYEETISLTRYETSSLILSPCKGVTADWDSSAPAVSLLGFEKLILISLHCSGPLVVLLILVFSPLFLVSLRLSLFGGYVCFRRGAMPWAGMNLLSAGAVGPGVVEQLLLPSITFFKCFFGARSGRLIEFCFLGTFFLFFSLGGLCTELLYLASSAAPFAVTLKESRLSSTLIDSSRPLPMKCYWGC